MTDHAKRQEYLKAQNEGLTSIKALSMFWCGVLMWVAFLSLWMMGAM
jgi:hypothetical protein